MDDLTKVNSDQLAKTDPVTASQGQADALPGADATTDTLLSYLRHRPEYANAVTASLDGKHPFHRRYNAKPRIFNAFIPGVAHLCRFEVTGFSIEFIEVQKDGLTQAVAVIDGDKTIPFRSVLEAEVYIADRLVAAGG